MPIRARREPRDRLFLRLAERFVRRVNAPYGPGRVRHIEVTVPPRAAFTFFCGSLAGSRIVTVTAFGSVATATFDELGAGEDAVGATLAEATGAEGAADGIGAGGDGDADAAGEGAGLSSHATMDNAM
jgi:hypothetical protein